MFKTYLRRHSDGRMENVTMRLPPDAALTEYRRLLARDDLAGQPWAAVLRDELHPVTVLFSRFDVPDQRLLSSDEIDLIATAIRAADVGSDCITRQIVEARR